MKNNRNHVKRVKVNMADKKIRKDNRGSAIILVIIAIAMISILASTIMWASYVNYMIKYADIRNKSSFYSSETVVEQIMAGVQHEASAAISLSYQEVMQNWSNDEDENSRFSRFATSYLDTLVESLKLSGTSNRYDRKVLRAYIDEDLFDRVDLDVWEGKEGGEADKYPPTMEIINNSTLVLHNIRVAYTDINDYVSIVNTDICIDVPKLVFYQNGNIDNLYEYAVIGNSGIETKEGIVSAVIDGSVYAGNEGADEGGIIINRASSLTIQNGRHVISQGDITVNGPTASFLVRNVPNEDNKVYAAGLNITSGTISLDSKTYVANDLILSGTGSRATLTKEYYGFGSSIYTGLNDEDVVEADKSSAILINGKSATVDMSGVTKLMLAGRAYIGQQRYTGSPIEPLNEGNPPILMGESIAVKGDQIAYLVPAECIGVLDGKTAIGQNPLNSDLMTKMEEYKEQYKNDPEHSFVEIDFSKPIYKLGNKSLSDFGVVYDPAHQTIGGENGNKHIRVVYSQYNGETLKYYYLVLDTDKAAEYFKQYYDFNTNKEALDKYFQKYASGGIILGDYDTSNPNTSYTILGNSVVSDVLGQPTLYAMEEPAAEGEGGGAGAGGAGTEGEAGTPATVYEEIEIGDNAQDVTNAWTRDDVLDMAVDINKTYESLCRDLTEDGSAGINENVFNSIIRQGMLRQYFIDHPELSGILKVEIDGYTAVLTNKENYTPDSSEINKIRLIVAIDRDYNPSDADSKVDGGNVTINNNFTGMIIAQGKVTIGNNVVINRDKTNVYKVLNAPIEEGSEDTVMNFFQSGSGELHETLTEEATDTSKVDASGTLDINLSQIVRYSNWIKK